MTGKEVRLVNEMASSLIRCLNRENVNWKSGCLFWDTTMCDGIKICSSCSLRIEEEGDKE